MEFLKVLCRDQYYFHFSSHFIKILAKLVLDEIVNCFNNNRFFKNPFEFCKDLSTQKPVFAFRTRN
jgi:hypothetical protein